MKHGAALLTFNDIRGTKFNAGSVTRRPRPVSLAMEKMGRSLDPGFPRGCGTGITRVGLLDALNNEQNKIKYGVPIVQSAVSGLSQ